MKELTINESEYDMNTVYSLQLGKREITLGSIYWNSILNPQYKTHFTEDFIYKKPEEKQVIGTITDYLEASDDKESIKNGIIYLALCALDDQDILFALTFDDVKGVIGRSENAALITANDRLQIALKICNHTNNPYNSFCEAAFKRYKEFGEDYDKELFFSELEEYRNNLNKSKNRIRK